MSTPNRLPNVLRAPALDSEPPPVSLRTSPSWRWTESALPNRTSPVPRGSSSLRGSVASGGFSMRGNRSISTLRNLLGRFREEAIASNTCHSSGGRFEKSGRSEPSWVLLRSQPRPALQPPTPEHVLAVLVPHSHAESMGRLLMSVIGLVGSLHSAPIQIAGFEAGSIPRLRQCNLTRCEGESASSGAETSLPSTCRILPGSL